MIELINVSKKYGDISAVDNLSLSVGSGEIFGFLGINGAGKSTTLRMLAGVLKPSSGTIKLSGLDISLEPEKAKAITGYIPDRPYLYAKLTGREFLYFVGDLYNVKFSEADKRIDELLEEYTLTEQQNELIESYSHGMRQRLATCAALIHKPKILIVDEPLVGLDPHGARLLKSRFKTYAAEGMCILLSTHSLDLAEEVSSRLAIIHKGKLVTLGTLAQIRETTGGLEDGLEEIFLELTSNFPDQ